MEPDKITAEINRLSLTQKLILAQDIWDSIALESKKLPMPEWQKRDQNMHMIFADNATYNPYFKTLTGLSDKLSYPEGKISLQHMITILGDPNKMVFDLKLRMASLTVFHTEKYRSTASKMLPA